MCLVASGCNFVKDEKPPEPRAGGGLEGETLALAGSTVYSDGSPAAGTRVVLRTSDTYSDTSEGLEKTVLAESDGSFRFTAIPPGDYYLISEGDGSAASFREVHLAAPGKADSVVTLSPDTLKTRGSVSGQIVFPAGLTPLPSGELQIPGLRNKMTIDTTGEIRIDDVPPGTYYIRILYPTLGLNHRIDDVVVNSGEVTDIGRFTLNPPGSEDLDTWPHVLTVQLNTTASGANIPSTVADFPLLIQLNSSNFPFDSVGAPMDGADLRFTDGTGKTLPYEIETWDIHNRLADIWVKADTVFGNRDNQAVNIHFGKTDVFSASAPRAVYDSALGHVAVWHFSGYGAGGFLADATYNKNHLRIGATVNTQGIIGKGRAIGSGDELAAKSKASLNPPSLTLSAWVRPDGAQADRACLFWKERSGSSVAAFSLTWLGKAGVLEFALATETSKAGTVTARAPLPPGQDWVHVAATFDAGTGAGTLFINGKPVRTFEDRSGIAYGSSGELVLGAQSGGKNAWEGVMDEIRISRQANAPARIALEYENQKPGSKLLTFP